MATTPVRSALALAALLLPGPVLAAEDWSVPSSSCRGLFIVPVTWNDETVELVLDTGAESSSIDPDVLRRVLGRSVKAGTSVTLRDGAAGPFPIGRMKARVHEMDHLAFAIGRPIDGILGFDVFSEHLLTLDYPGSRITVSHGGLPPVDQSRVFPTIGRRHPYIGLELGGRTLPLLVDSGFSGGIDLDREDPIAWETEPRPIAAAVRYAKVVNQGAGRSSGPLTIGPLTLERPVVRVSDGTRLLGARILERFVLTFDDRNRRIRMSPDSDVPMRFEPVRTMGLAIHPRGAVGEVIEVFPGSAAAVAGIRVGDLLRTIDGTPVAARGCVPVLDEDARSLGFERDGRRFEVTIEPAVVIS